MASLCFWAAVSVVVVIVVVVDKGVETWKVEVWEGAG